MGSAGESPPLAPTFLGKIRSPNLVRPIFEPLLVLKGFTLCKSRWYSKGTAVRDHYKT